MPPVNSIWSELLSALRVQLSRRQSPFLASRLRRRSDTVPILCAQRFEHRTLLAALLDSVAPTLISTTINGGSNNWSGIATIAMTFDESVTIAGVSSFNLFNHTAGTSVGLVGASLGGNGTSTVTLDLTGLVSPLPDGCYTLEVPASVVTPNLAGTHTIAFSKLSGDIQGDGVVNFNDTVPLSLNFGTSGEPYRDGDGDGDGIVNFDDTVPLTLNFGASLAPMTYDFGDAPSPTFSTLLPGGARHVITGNTLRLGASRDAEADGQQSVDATGDGADEDGVSVDPLIPGTNVAVMVTSSGAGFVNAWIDFNQDGDWDDPGEYVFDDIAVADGENNLQIAVPAGASPGETIARFRLTGTAGYSYFGLASDGEVEDYELLVASAAAPQIILGPSDNIALDQPRVTVLLTQDLDGDQQVGPFLFNEFLLDTGSNSILAFATATSEMVDGTYSFQTEGVYSEFGVGGPSLFDIGAPYYFYFAANGNGYVPPPPLPETRILSNADSDLSILGPWGIGGMPLMEGRVVSFDFSGWSGGLLPDLSNIYMVTTFTDTVPTGKNRFTVSIDNRIAFDAEAGIVSGDNPPIWSDIPFLSATLATNAVDRPGNFLLDTGGQLSILSTSAAFDLNLDSNGDGLFDVNDANYVDSFEIGGVGGSITAPMFYIEELRLPTEEGEELVWTDLGWLILDIETGEEHLPLDGVFGMDNLTGGWINTVFENGPDGYFQQVHLDLRDWAEGTGALLFDLTTLPSADVAFTDTSGPAISPYLESLLSTSGTFSLADHLKNLFAPATATRQHRLNQNLFALPRVPTKAHETLFDSFSNVFPSRRPQTLSILEKHESSRLSLITTSTLPPPPPFSIGDPAEDSTNVEPDSYRQLLTRFRA